MGGCAQLPSAQLHAREDARRRQGLLLPFELPRARYRGNRRSRLGALPRREPVRPEEPLLRRDGKARSAALVQCRREVREENPTGQPRRVARASRARFDARAHPRQPALDHPGGRARMGIHHPAPHEALRRADEHAAERHLDSRSGEAAHALHAGMADAPGRALSPRVQRCAPLRDEASIAKLAAPDPAEDLRYVGDAVAQIRRALAGRVPLIGFAGSPYTLACYMVEGGASEDWRTVKVMLYRRPDLLHRLLETNSRAVSVLLNAQIEAGAQIAMIFDTWGGSLPAAAYREFSLAYIERVLSQLNRGEGGARVPVIVFTKGGAPWLESIAATGCDCVGLDSSPDLGEARRRIGGRVALQGNLDPMVLLASPEEVRRETEKVLESFGSGAGHVFNLGHGVPQLAPPENVAALVAAVHELSPKFHRSG